MARTIEDRYRLDSEVGSGGMATVWLAWDLVRDRACAVKILHLTSGPGAEAHRRRLQAEAAALQALDHPHVVKIWDHGEYDGQDFIAMEYVEGGSLSGRLATDGPLAPRDAVDLMIQVLSALQAAHQAGIVHRDVKPPNILLRSADNVALGDFGIARQAERGDTQTGMALGSVGYMAPEQRIDARRVGPAADLYAVACTLFNLVTQDTPIDLYLAPDHSPRWADVPAPLLPILRRATQADPEDRYHNAEEMAQALGAVRGALAGVRPVRRGRPASALPTVDVGSESSSDVKLDVVRPRKVRPEDWRDDPRQPAGGMARWVGLGLILIITAAGLAARPVLADLRERLTNVEGEPEEVVVPEPAAPELEGTWFGNLDGERQLELTVTGEPEALVAQIKLRLGTHERRSTLQGRWTDAQLVLEEPGGPMVLRGALGAGPRLLVGELWPQTDEEPLRFAIVWMR